MSFYPHSRLRRTRSYPFLRDLVSETSLSVNDLIWPIFIREPSQESLIASMPGIKRYALEELDEVVQLVTHLGLKSIALFPHTPASKRDSMASVAYDEDNLICKALRYFRVHLPNVILIADVALDPYTDHGHDGLIHEARVHNDKTVEALVKQALTLAKSGAHIVAPSDMMDGRIGKIRAALDDNGFELVSILSYCAKYSSCFYGPFRHAVGAPSLGAGLQDKATYQMDPRNAKEALRECAQDIHEGADMLMIKPGLPYLDVLKMVTSTYNLPTFVYQISGEYAQIKAAAQLGWLDERSAFLETMVSFKRAGASGILTYAAPLVAQLLKEGTI